MSNDLSTPSASPILRSTRKRDDLPKGLNRHPAGGYFIRYACAVGHIHEQRTGRSLEAATKKLGNYRADAEKGWCPRRAREQRREAEAAKRQAQAQDVTVRQLGVRWLKTHVEPNLRVRTAAQYRSVLERHVFPGLGDLPLRDVTRARLREFLTGLVGVTWGTKKNVMVPLATMLSFAVDEDRLPANPASGLFRQRRRARTEAEARTSDALTADELRLALGAVEMHAPDLADFITLLSWSGLRLAEACGLQWGDFDAKGGFLNVRRSATFHAERLLVAAPKSGRTRRVDIPAELVRRLHRRQSLLEAEAAVAGRELGEWMFPALSDPSKPINGAVARKVWHRCLRRAGLRAVRLHDLRHTFASLLLASGAPVQYVSALLGHSSIAVTVDRYGHVRTGTHRGVVDALAQATGAEAHGVVSGALPHLGSTSVFPRTAGLERTAAV